MFDIDKWQEIFASISRHKLRTALTAFGVFWGIFMLMLLLGAGAGLEKGVTGMFGGMSKNAAFVWTRKTTVAYKGMQPGRRFYINETDIQYLKQNISNIEYICPRLNLVGQFVISHNDKSGSFEVTGDAPDYINVESRRFVKGRFLNDLDIVEKRKVAVIGKRVAELLFEEDEPIVNQYIDIKGSYFKVIGVVKSMKTGEGVGDDEQSIHIPYTTTQQMNNWGNNIGWFAFTVPANMNVENVEGQVRHLLSERHKVSPDDKDAIGSWNTQKEFQQFQGVFTGINLFTWAVGIGTLIAGIVGVSNIMLIAVKERTREFGLRKALGATPFSIISLVIQESVLLTAVAGYMGLVVAVGLIEGVSYLMTAFNVQLEYFGNPEINFKAAIAATSILIITGAIAGLIPASQAAMIKPIEALRAK
ncbi:MAG: ABC transporter permease [Chitinophagales bacterium]